MAGQARFFRARHALTASVTPTFFYHLPKCAGMSLHSAAQFAWNHLAKAAKSAGPRVGRIDEQDALERWQGIPYAFVSSHLPFGAHAALTGQPELVTFLRDPVGRLRSAFTYRNMRDGVRRSADDFGTFIRDETNRNVMAKTLAGLPPQATAGAETLSRAQDHLRAHFAVHARHTQIDAFITHYLRRSGLPNVIAAQINVTADPFLIDPQPFEAEIRALNAADEALFAFVAGAEKMPPALPDDGSAHPLTVILYQDPAAQAVLTQSLSAPTDHLRRAGIVAADWSVNGPALKALLETLPRAKASPAS